MKSDLWKAKPLKDLAAITVLGLHNSFKRQKFVMHSMSRDAKTGSRCPSWRGGVRWGGDTLPPLLTLREHVICTCIA